MTTQHFTPAWSNQIRFAFSQKTDGQMSFKRADPAKVTRNQRAFLSQLNLPLEDIVTAELIHSNGVKIVTKEHRGRGAFARDWLQGMDGMVTNDPGVLLLTTHADCPPIVIYDPKHQVLGQAHACWRSLAIFQIALVFDAVLFSDVLITQMVESDVFEISSIDVLQKKCLMLARKTSKLMATLQI